MKPIQRGWQFTSTVLGIIFRHPITGTTIIPILPDGKIVLVKRKDTGRWGLPGGIVDWGEDLPSAAHRELREETGLSMTKVRRLVGVYSAPDRDPRIHSISVLIAADVEGIPHVKDQLEIAEARAFKRDELPLGQLSHDHDRQLADFLQEATTFA